MCALESSGLLRGVAVVLLLSLASCAATSGPDMARAIGDDTPVVLELQEVRTWWELSQQPGIALPEGRVARLGVEAKTGRRLSGVLMYCLIEGPTPWRDTTGWTGQGLGPFEVSVEVPGSRSSEQSLLEQSQRLPEEAPPKQGRWLYAQTIAFPEASNYRVTITMREGGRVIAQATVRATDGPVHPWMPFGSDTGPDAEAAMEADEAYNWDYEAHVSTRKDGLIVPAFDGSQPIDWRLGDTAKRPDKTPLPRLIPEHPDAGLKLTVLDGQHLAIESDRDMIVARPDWHYLVRWWVNDRPYVPQQVDAWADANGIMTTGRRVLLRLTIHPEHLDAKPGDRISVQLLHCPHGWQFVADMAMMSMAHAMMDTPQPHRMTNRVDFVLPQTD